MSVIVAFGAFIVGNSELEMECCVGSVTYDLKDGPSDLLPLRPV